MPKKIFIAFVAALIVLEASYQISKDREKGRSDRKKVLDEVGLDVHAIHLATDVVNGRIERGEIRSYDELKEAVLTEVAFQKMAVREDT